MTTLHKGTCFCGAVQVEISGALEGAGYRRVQPAAYEARTYSIRADEVIE